MGYLKKRLCVGILREGKIPVDHRVPFTPAQVGQLVADYPDVDFMCQRSPIRCYSDAEYERAGARLVDVLRACDIHFGVKEVPISDLMANRTYLFFSHTTKRQSYNKALLREILHRKIRLIDYEHLRDATGRRVVAFGRYAGIVGAYNALWAYGLVRKTYVLPRARDCRDYEALKQELKRIRLPRDLKFVLTGTGRVSGGAAEVLACAGVQKVSPRDFLEQTFDAPVYAMLSSIDYHAHKDGTRGHTEDFHLHPETYVSTFSRYAACADVLIACAYWHPAAPRLFTPADACQKDFRISLVSDITCDIDGSLPCTKRASTIADPLYAYDPVSDSPQPLGADKKHMVVSAVDNLPCELPRDASHAFGQELMRHVVPALLDEDKAGMVARATIAEQGRLGEAYAYLASWVGEA